MARPYGSGPYGTGVYQPYSTREIAGVSFVAFDAGASLAFTWAEPAQLCGVGTWTKTSAPFPVADTSVPEPVP